jgi:hypothetical protein
VLDVLRLCHSKAKLATHSEVLVSLKKTPADGGEPKDPGFDRLSPSAFEWRFVFFPRIALVI